MHRRRARPPLSDLSNQAQQPAIAAAAATSLCSSEVEVRRLPSPPSDDDALQASTDMAMEMDACVSTPHAKVPEKQASPFVTYSRRKPASHASMSCPPQCHRRDRRGTDDGWNNRSHVKRGFSAMNFDGDDASMEVAVSRKMRRRSLPNMPKWLPEDFVSEQTCHFAEVDAFQLVEEEGDLSEED